MITIRVPDEGEFQSYLALPRGGRGPGIVVLQEIFGVNQQMASSRLVLATVTTPVVASMVKRPPALSSRL